MTVRPSSPERFAVYLCIASFACSPDNEPPRSQETESIDDRGDGDIETPDSGSPADDACKGPLDEFCMGTDCPTYQEVASFVYDRVYYCTSLYALHVSPCGDYVEVSFAGGLHGVHYYFDSNYELVGAMPYSDVNEFCGGRHFRGEFGDVPSCPDVEDPCARCESSQNSINSLRSYCSIETCPTYDELAEAPREGDCQPETRLGSCENLRLVQQRTDENMRTVWYFDAGKVLMGVRIFSPADSATDSTDYGSIPACAPWELEPGCMPVGMGGAGW